MAPPVVAHGPGYSPPAQYIDPTHHGGWIVISTAIGLALLLLCLLIRLYVRVAIHPITGAEDYILSAVAVSPRHVGRSARVRGADGPQGFAVVQSCLVFWEVSIGLGDSIELVSPNHVRQLQKVEDSWPPVGRKIDLCRRHMPATSFI